MKPITFVDVSGQRGAFNPLAVDYVTQCDDGSTRLHFHNGTILFIRTTFVDTVRTWQTQLESPG